MGQPAIFLFLHIKTLIVFILKYDKSKLEIQLQNS